MVPYSREIADQRRKYGENMLRRCEEHLATQKQWEAESQAKIEAARMLTYNAARRKEEGKDFVREAAIAKYAASQVAQKVAGAAIEWAGGVGFTRETGIEKYWRDSKIVSFFLLTLRLRSRILSIIREQSTRARRTSSFRPSRR